MRFNIFFALFFIVSILMYVFIKPEVIDQKKVEKIPFFEFSDFTAYQLQEDKLRLMLIGKKAYSYEKDTYIEDLSIYAENNKVVHRVSAKKGHQTGDIIFLDEDIVYNNSNNVAFYTQKARYNAKEEIFDIRVPFTLTQNENTFSGTSFFFNQRHGKIHAKRIKAEIELIR